MDANHTALLYHTQVRWLSKGNMFSHIFELREVKLFLVAKQKNDLILAFGGDKFPTYLAYLADVFETLNQLNKKLQGPGSNVIVHMVFGCKQKNDLLLAFGGDKFSMYFAYLADIFS